jgi:hypothetical protein
VHLRQRFRLPLPPRMEQLTDPRQIAMRAGPRVVVRATVPDGGLVELDALASSATVHHCAHAAVAQWHRLDPSRGGRVVPERQRSGGRLATERSRCRA